MKKNVFLIIILTLIVSVQLNGQNEHRFWFFGNKAGLDFITSPPATLTTGSINTVEGCATISDAAGNLLFYTDGITIWDQAHNIMGNGTGLTGNTSSSQSAIIVKQPGNTNLFYVFSQGSTFTATA